MKIVSLASVEVLGCAPNTMPAIAGRKAQPFKVTAKFDELARVAGSDQPITNTIIKTINSEVMVPMGKQTVLLAHGKLDNGSLWYRVIKVLSPAQTVASLFLEEVKPTANK